jgi:hypothetical protein
MHWNEKAPGAGSAPGAMDHNNDDVNRRQYGSKSGARKQAESAAERLFKLFAGNLHRHIRNYGPPVWNEKKQKWELRGETVNEPATLKDWDTHLYPTSEFILSIIPLLDDGTCWFACIDLDKYSGVDFIKICELIHNLKL